MITHHCSERLSDLPKSKPLRGSAQKQLSSIISTRFLKFKVCLRFCNKFRRIEIWIFEFLVESSHTSSGKLIRLSHRSKCFLSLLDSEARLAVTWARIREWALPWDTSTSSPCQENHLFFPSGVENYWFWHFVNFELRSSPQIWRGTMVLGRGMV